MCSVPFSYLSTTRTLEHLEHIENEIELEINNYN